jgi:hypothetical protein
MCLFMVGYRVFGIGTNCVPQAPEECSEGLRTSDQRRVYVAPSPIFSRLERLDYRMPDCMEVLPGVFILRVVATTHVPAGQALAQMHPSISHLKALLAALG